MALRLSASLPLRLRSPNSRPRDLIHSSSKGTVHYQMASKAVDVALALKSLLPSKLPPSLLSQSSTLYRVLSRYPRDGVGQRVHQTRWSAKGIEGCYWEVTRSKLKLEGNHGQVWGKLVWRGMQFHGSSREHLRIALLCFCSTHILTIVSSREACERTDRTDTRRPKVPMDHGSIARESDVDTKRCINKHNLAMTRLLFPSYLFNTSVRRDVFVTLQLVLPVTQFNLACVFPTVRCSLVSLLISLNSQAMLYK